MKKLFHPVVVFLVRFVLGGLLIYASYHKIVDPPDFAKSIYNYKLVPAPLINLFAIYLPWVELIAGAALITGVGLRGGAAIAGLLFLAFLADLAYDLARGCPTPCGCFETSKATENLTDAEKFAEMKTSIIRDIGLVLLSGHAFAGSFFRAGKRKEPPPVLES